MLFPKTAKSSIIDIKAMLIDTPRVHSRLDLLYTITRELNAAGLDIDQVLNRVLSATIVTVGASDANLFLFDAHDRLETFSLISNFEEVEEFSQSDVETMLNHGLAGWVKAHRQAVLIADTNTDERWYINDSHPELYRAGSAVAVPIQLPDQFIGILIITAPESGHFDQSDLAMLTIIADQAAFAIVNARLFKAEQHRRRLADTLVSIAHTINSTLDLNEVLDLILEQLALVIDHDSSSILLCDNNGDSLSVRAARGFDDMEDALSVTLPLYEGIPNYQAIVQKKPIVIADVDTEPNWKKTSSTRNVRGWIGVPLIAHDKVIGMLTFDSHEVNKYTPEDVELVAGFADHAAIAVANAQAVTRLQNAEASYTALFEDSADMILITDYYGLILNVNRKACQMLRWTKGALIGNNISFIHSRLGEYLVEQTKRLKRWREASIELDVPDAYHQTVSLELRARQVYYDGKDCVAWIGRDISARKEAERMRQDLVNMLVHDLRGPLGNLINTIELLAMILGQTEDNPTIHRTLEMAKYSGQEVRDLVDSMLDISRLEQGEILLQRDMVDIGKMIEAVKQQIIPRAESREMELTFNLLPEMPSIWIDGSMTRRILINLLDNAIKYTPYGGKISLTTTLTDDAFCFAVSDNGPGISKADRAHIFEKFSRVDNSANAPSGVGLGLAFCKLATEAHEGTISVESEGVPGQGSTFHLSIPLITEVDNLQ